MMRCFIAIKIPEEISKKISEFCDLFLVKSNLRLRAVPPKNYHITLKFLGDTENENILPIESELHTAAKELDKGSVPLSLGELLFFPSRSGRGSIVIKVSGALRPIAELIDEKMGKFGYRKSRNLAPHITIFRLKEKAIPLIDEYNVGNLRFRADSFSLFQSVLNPKGSIYKELSTFRWREDE